jgi:hypothetical protein
MLGVPLCCQSSRFANLVSYTQFQPVLMGFRFIRNHLSFISRVVLSHDVLQHFQRLAWLPVPGRGMGHRGLVMVPIGPICSSQIAHEA